MDIGSIKEWIVEQNTQLLNEIEARYQNAMKSGDHWVLSADEFLSAYALGRRNFYFCVLANLTDANLTRADLTDAKGMLSPIQYLEQQFEWSSDGLIVYKTFGSEYSPNPTWKIEPGSVIEEVPNPCRGVTCGCGVNVATREWINWNGGGGQDIWRALIRWKWLPGVIVPFDTDGKIRASKVELVEIVK